MPELMETADELGPEKILHVYDPAAGMKAVELLFQRGYISFPTLFPMLARLCLGQLLKSEAH